MTQRILSFSGAHRWLSNFWPARVYYEGQIYPTVEHAYVAAKTEDPAERARVLACEQPGQVKRLGRSLTLRRRWDDAKVYVMEALLTEKFSSHNPELQQQLLATGDAFLLEGNQWHDQFWGSCFCKKRPGCTPYGRNELGRLLMAQRDRLRSIIALHPKDEALAPTEVRGLCRTDGYAHERHTGVCGPEVHEEDLAQHFHAPFGSREHGVVDGRFTVICHLD